MDRLTLSPNKPLLPSSNLTEHSGSLSSDPLSPISFNPYPLRGRGGKSAFTFKITV